MERRTFVQKTTLISSIALLSSPIELLANETANCELDLTSFLSQGKKIIINGSAFDSISNNSINATIKVASGYGLFSKTRTSTIKNGRYLIAGNVLKEGMHKIKVKIEAEGYKTFDGHFYVNKTGCLIHSDMWQYNPDFKPEFIPKNSITTDSINSKFNFYLVRA